MRKEFILWSVCTNPGADPRHNASSDHTRLSAEIIFREQRVDGLIVWDMVCGTIGRPCPKLADDPARATIVGPYLLPPPCVYVFPATIPSPRNNPHPSAQAIEDVQILKAFHDCFGSRLDDINYVTFEVQHRGADCAQRVLVARVPQR